MGFALAFFAMTGTGVIGIWIVAVRVGRLLARVEDVAKDQRDIEVRLRSAEDQLIAIQRDRGHGARVLKPFETG